MTLAVERSPALNGSETAAPQAFPAGTTWAVICLAVEAGTLKEIEGEWREGPLPDAFGARDGAPPEPFTPEDRSKYYGSDVSSLLYGTSSISKRYHRDISLFAGPRRDRAADGSPEDPTVHHIGLERMRLRVGRVHVEILMVHLAVVSHRGLPASSGDRDLAVLESMLNAESMEEILPSELINLMLPGVVLDPQTQPWFTLLRTAPNKDFTLARRGAANGSSPRDAAVTVDLANERKPVVVRLSTSWDMEVGPRGVGFTLHAEDRDSDPAFHDTKAPARVRSVSSDKVLLVFLQEILLSRLSARAAAVQLPGDRATTEDLEAVQTLLAEVATFYAKVWWSSTGRGGKRDTDFVTMQAQWDLRERLGDLVAISEGLRNVLSTRVLQRTQHSQVALSWALAAVAALAVPQTVLSALQSASPAARSHFHGLLAPSALVWFAFTMAGLVLLALLGFLAYAGSLRLRASRTPASLP